MKILLLAALGAGVASAAPALYTVNGVQYVNPYDFAASHGGSVGGESVGKAWVLSVNGRQLHLINNSKVAYLNGQRVQLSEVVGYARGRLLAPYGDLARLLGASGQARQVAIPVRPLSQTANPTAARLPRPARGPLDPYVIESDVPPHTEDLARANYQTALGDPADVNGVVRSCLEGAGQQLGLSSPALVSRPFVFVHPDNVYSLRGGVRTASGRGSFTCLARWQGGKLTAYVEVREGR